MYDEEESIYQLVAQQKAAAQKPPTYKSKHNHSAPPSFSTFGLQGTSKILGNVAGEPEEKYDGTHPAKKPCGTFGRAVGQHINPKQFLHKSSSQQKPALQIEAKHDRAKVKPPVPARDDKPVMGLKTDKNFVVANAVENILAAPKKVPEATARAVDKGTYGRVPAYINRTKRELELRHAQAESQKSSSTKEAASELEELSPEEAAELKAGLKARWEILNKQFATLSFDLETDSQIRRKEALEAKLAKLEQALQRLNKTHIFVCPDP